jgi:hypothetical protein
VKNPLYILAALAAALSTGTAPAIAHEEPTRHPDHLKVIPPREVVKKMHARKNALAPAQSAVITSAVVGPALRIFPYTVVSPRDGNTYSGTIVGADPRNNGARTTSVEVVLIPLRIVFTGTVRTFDPTSPDAGCLGSNTALEHTKASPLFTPVPNYTINGVNMGNVTFIDAFQRAQFWQDAIGGPVVSVKPAYHLGLPITQVGVQTITMANGGISGVTVSLTGDCGTNATSADNPPRLAEVDINFMDVKLNQIITALGLTPAQFPLFLTYRTVMTDGTPNGTNCCILGYHNSSTFVPSNPGQTYGIANYDNDHVFTGVKNTSVLSHEILEWANDPSGNNLVPEWGNIGQVGGCTAVGTGQNNLETGDPLSGHLQPGVLMPNGVTYYSQENAFFSWFLGTGFTAAGGKFSSNGTFSGYAKNCPPGGTN